MMRSRDRAIQWRGSALGAYASFRLGFQESGSILPIVGGVSATFTRATTATSTDWEAIVRIALAAQVRMVGQRTVTNLFTTNTTTLNVAANQTITATVGTYVFSMGVGAGTVTFTGTATGSTGSLTANSSNRTANTLTITTGGTIICTASVATLNTIQIENVTGQSNQNPGEYVSVGLLPPPFHGLNVDGARSFPWLNGNTVTANVVTEATGALISTSINRGALIEPAATNRCLFSEELDNVIWSKSGLVVTADQYIAPSGFTTADRLRASAGLSTHFATQSITFVGSIETQSYYLRFVNNRWCAITIFDGTTTFAASFDLLNGVTGALSANTISKIETTNIAGVYRCTLATAVATAAAAGNTSISLNNNNVATIETWTAAGTEDLGVWGIDTKTGNLIGVTNTYIPTTTVAATRNADSLIYPTTGWFNAAAFSQFAQFLMPGVPIGATLYVYSINDTTANNVISCYLTNPAGTVTTNFEVRAGGVQQTLRTINSPAAGTVVKTMFVGQANDFIAFQNNVATTAGASGTLPTVTRLEVGAQLAANQIGTPIATELGYPSRLPNSTAQALTA
jgi:hypothetical protein